MSIHKRLTLYYSITIVAVGLVLTSVFLWVLINAVSDSVHATAQTHAELAATMLKAGEPLDQRAMARLTTDHTAIIARDSTGRIVVQSRPLSFRPGGSDTALWQAVLATNQPNQQEGHQSADIRGDVHIYAVPVNLPGTSIRVVEAITSYAKTGRSQFAYELYLVLFVLALIVAAVVIGYLLARAALHPVKSIATAAEEIGAHDLSRRLPAPNPRDELGRLSATFNGLLARLEVAFHEREVVLEREQRFIADASHELRTPLTSILGYARMLRSWGLHDPVTAEEAIAAIEREAGRMHVLVDDLLRLARGDEQPSLDLQQSNLVEIAREAAHIVVSVGIDLTFREPIGQVPVMLDRDRMRQVIGILLDNAVKYSRPNGSIDIIIRAQDGVASLSVEDTGIGIATTDLPYIFDRFYRSEKARSTEGNGLGLAIARQIVEAHGGTIEVESQLASGSVFHVCLPLAETVDASPASVVHTA